MNPQIFGVVMDRLYAAGALEVFYVAGADEEEPAGHAADGRRAARAARERCPTSSSARRRRSACGTHEVERECLQREIVTRRHAARRRSGSRWPGATGASSTPCRSSRTARRWPRRSNLSVKDVQAIAVQAYGAQQPATDGTIVSRFYITTPIYYINAEPHLGHAYTTMVADAVARAHRLMGDDVFFLTGTDEHGQKVERAAQKAGLPTHGVRRPDGAEVPRPAAAAEHLERRLHPDDRAAALRGRAGALAPGARSRLHLQGQVRRLVLHGRRGLRPGDAAASTARCPTAATRSRRIAEESYFFKLSAFQQPLLDHYRSIPISSRRPVRRNEMLSFLEGRPRGSERQPHVVQVGHSGAGRSGARDVRLVRRADQLHDRGRLRSDEPAAAARFAKYWPADVHLIGKEIVRQHAIYWPAFLMAAGLPLPRQIVSHGWWLMDGAKMSKSKGNVVRPQDYIARFGLDAFRYFVFREMVFGQDANFTDERSSTRYNADLANDLGNLVSRATTMIHRYCDGSVPAPDAALLRAPAGAATVRAASTASSAA